MSKELDNLEQLHAPSYIFTFCNNNVHAHCYVEIKADDYFKARKVMSKHFGENWGFQYSNKESAGVDKYGLLQIGLDGKDVK